VRSTLVNAEETTRRFPKGNTHNSRTMEHYRRLGLAEAIRAVGLPPDHPTDVGYFTRLNGYELARLPMPTSLQKLETVRRSDTLDQVPEPIHRANQMYVEAILGEHVRTLPRVELRFGWRCTEVAEAAEHVEARIEDAEGRSELLRCRHLVGCDGGRSLVRRAMGIRYGGEAGLDQQFFGGTMISTHLRIPQMQARIAAKPCWQYWTVNPGLRMVLYPLDGGDEFLIHTKPAADAAPPDDEAIARLVRENIGAETEFEILGHGAWTAGQALVADGFGSGRVLLCGDSAHLFTPTGGFGMNTGIDDAANLAWKLAASLEGWGGPRLPASYESERRPVAIRNTSTAHRFSRNVGEVPVPPEMEDDSAAGEEARRRAGEVLSTFTEEFASIGIQLGARYDGSPLIASDGSSPPPDDPFVYTPSASPGGRAPHFWMPDRSSLYDHLGRGFTLVCFGEPGERAQRLQAVAAQRGIPLELLALGAGEARELYERDQALIRPDQHVAWRGDCLPDDPGELLDRVTGWVEA
jgi:2-polyprenyl-6-methoxyphenol hydroxylase-like FAD-dependent oxidoreductase